MKPLHNSFQKPAISRHCVLLGLLGMLLTLSGCTTLLATPTSTPEPTATPIPTSTPFELTGLDDLFLLSLVENGYAHLFAYSPKGLPLTRLTSGEWNDITPSLSPDGKRLAFASNRDGSYNLYILDLQSGELRQVTNTPDYNAAPSWSPDMSWLAFETYTNDNLEIALLLLADLDQEPVRLTEDPGADYAPAWSPYGRQIAFVSSRTGDSDIWLADLDITDEGRYINLSHTPQATEDHPTWTNDSSHLAWASSSVSSAFSGIYLWEAANPSRPAHWIGTGSWPAWNADGDQIVAQIDTPNAHYLTAYSLEGSLLLQPTRLPGFVRGLVWNNLTLPDPLPENYQKAAAEKYGPLWIPFYEQPDDKLEDRWALMDLKDVVAPCPQLHDQVDEAFASLRQRVIEEAGWDAMANLQNAFTPLTTSLDPGLGDDWLYTGRAFALNPVVSNAGWMAAVREDFGQQTYWRVYLRTLKQDGSMGEPLHTPPWDLNARFALDPRSYEQGGKFAPVPTGYWIDFTLLANEYGWNRQPALPNWRTYFNGARFTEFVMDGDLDWYSAMLQIYPSEILITPTSVSPPTFTPTKTPYPTWTPKPTRTPKITPSATQPPSPTPTITDTPLPYLPTPGGN
ncbi:MAG: TolB family protein [Anaerolineales bacterium]|nr:TolB family protein [Anaerolineales bacterium]